MCLIGIEVQNEKLEIMLACHCSGDLSNVFDFQYQRLFRTDP